MMATLSNEHDSSHSSSEDGSCATDSSDDFRVISVSNAPNSATPANEADSGEVKEAEDCDGAEEPGRDDAAQARSPLYVQEQNLRKWVESVKDTRSGAAFTDMIRKNKNFRNPAIFEKMISYCGIDEFGTNVTERKPLDKQEFYKDICDVQELCMKDSD